MDQTIEFEMENYLPLPLEELLLDYQILATNPPASTVLASYAKKSEFVKFMNSMSGADLDPRFVGCEPVEIANIMKLGILQPEGVFAVIDLGHEKTNVVIFSGKFQYAR